jgi:bifunctional non-homologous end joining protein LigD
VVFVAFDLLVDGEPIIDQPYAGRRRALEALDLPCVAVTPSYPSEDAPALLEACEDTGMEGVVLKRLDSPYLPGKRTDAWRKVKCVAWSEHARRRYDRGDR